MFIFIFLPLVVAGFMPLVGKISKRTAPDILAAGVLFILLVCSCIVFVPFISETWQYVESVSFMNHPLNITVALDGFSGLFLFLIALVGFIVSLFSIDYMEIYGSKGNYYALFLIIVSALNGLVLSSDLFNIYIFLEVAAIASFGLVAFGLGAEALEGAYKYLLLSAVGSGFILLGIILIFGITGTLSFDGIKNALSVVDNKPAINLCLILFIAGFGLKAALIPFHAWMPDAYTNAPATLPAISSGLIIKVSGVYAIARLVYDILGMPAGVSSVLLFLGMLSIVAGAFLALGQNNMKRMLAYSSISQIGYIITGFGIGTYLGVLAAVFHIFNHSIFKSLLFLNAGSVEKSTGTQSLDEMSGLGKRMPVTSTTNIIGILSTAGVPPTNGFWSKLFIVVALVQARMFTYAFIAIFMSVFTLWYLLLIQRRAFFGTLNKKWNDVKESPFWMSLSVIILALICMVIGIAFPFVIRNIIVPASAPLAKMFSAKLFLQ